MSEADLGTKIEQIIKQNKEKMNWLTRSSTTIQMLDFSLGLKSCSSSMLVSFCRYHELDLKKSLRENLMFKTVVEYPELHVVVKGHCEEYRTRIPGKAQTQARLFLLCAQPAFVLSFIPTYSSKCQLNTFPPLSGDESWHRWRAKKCHRPNTCFLSVTDTIQALFLTGKGTCVIQWPY